MIFKDEFFLDIQPRGVHVFMHLQNWKFHKQTAVLHR